ncbi:TPA: tyrosine-type recombinase/integrase [Clostridium perfringens]|nr:tyrosine-type recombinase/integrase [Clostridium perfringens]
MGQSTKPIKDKKKLMKMQLYLKANHEVAYIYFILAITTGYRASDLIDLTVIDVKKAIKKKAFCIVEKKRENLRRSKMLLKKEDEFSDAAFKKTVKPRIAQIGDTTIKILQEFIKDKNDWEYVFPSPKGYNHFSIRRMGVIINEAAEKCGIDFCVANHGLRKTYGYITYEKLCQKKDPIYALLMVQENLMHSTPEITKRYIGLEEEDNEMIVNCLDELITE